MSEKLYQIRVAVIGDQDLQKFQRAIEGMNKSASQSQAALNKMQKGMSGVGSALKTLAPLIASAFSVRAIKNVIETADAIGKVADATGLSVEGYQELAFAAERSGVATSQFNSNMTAFVKRIGEAKQGVGPLVSGLKDMNSSLLENLKNSRSQEEAIRILADGIQNAETATERAAIANAAFGRSGVAMVNMLRDGAKGLDDYGRKARELGIIYEENLVRSAEKYNDMLTDLQLQFQATFGKAALTVITTFVDNSYAMMISLFAGIDKMLVGVETLWKVTWESILHSTNQAITAVLTPFRKVVEWAGKYSDKMAELGARMPKLADNTAQYSAELKRITESHKNQIQAIDRHAESMIRQNDAMREGRKEVKEFQKALENATTSGGQFEQSVQKKVSALDQYRNSLLEAHKAQELMADKVLVLNKLYLEGKISTDTYRKAVEDLEKSLKKVDSGMKTQEKAIKDTGKAIDETKAKTVDFGKVAEQALGNAVTNAARSMVDAIFTGGQSITETLKQIAISMAKMVAEALAAEAAMWALGKAMDALGMGGGGGGGGMFGGGGGGGIGGALSGGISGFMMGGPVGGIIGGIGGLIGLAKGGIVPQGMITAANGGFVTQGPMKFYQNGIGSLTPAARGLLIGEAGQEAVMPLKRSASGRLGVEAVAGGGVNINIHNSSNSDIKAVSRESVSGGYDIDFYITEAVKKEFKRGGYDRALKAGFNLGRRGM